MELHWETFHKEDDIDECCAVLGPGIWLTLVVEYVRVYNEYRCKLVIHNLSSSETIYSTFVSNKDEHEQKVINCKKYANIIASSFLNQQHPYRDYPRNL